MATWPSYAEAQIAGYSELPRAGVVRTPMESGFPKQRIIESRVLRRVQLSAVISTSANYQLFLTWWQTTIGRVGWFDWTDPASASTVSARIVGGELAAHRIPGTADAWRIELELEHWNT